MRYSGKAHVHGGNIQAVSAPDGFPLRASRSRPPRCTTSPLPAFMRCPRPTPAAAAGLPTLANRGYDGAGIGIHIPARQQRGGRNSISAPAAAMPGSVPLRCLGEGGFALLKDRWRTLQHITASTGMIGDIARAVLVRTHFEQGYIK